MLVLSTRDGILCKLKVRFLFEKIYVKLTFCTRNHVQTGLFIFHVVHSGGESSNGIYFLTKIAKTSERVKVW